MFAVQKTSIARNTVVCAAQKPVQAKVRRERRISRQQEFHRGLLSRGCARGAHGVPSSISFRIGPIGNVTARAAEKNGRDVAPDTAVRRHPRTRPCIVPLILVLTRSHSFSLVLILLRQAVPQQKAALATMAAFAASVLLSAAPAQADVKSTVCAHNATARICLKDSAKK